MRQKDPELKRKIDAYAEDIKTKGHLIGDHGLSEAEFYESGILEGAIQRVWGQISANMTEKKPLFKPFWITCKKPTT